MSQILVEESALESIKAMARQLQQERDELLAVVGELLASRKNEAAACLSLAVAEENFCNPNPERRRHTAAMLWSMQAEKQAKELVDRCTTTPKVME